MIGVDSIEVFFCFDGYCVVVVGGSCGIGCSIVFVFVQVGVGVLVCVCGEVVFVEVVQVICVQGVVIYMQFCDLVDVVVID